MLERPNWFWPLSHSYNFCCQEVCSLTTPDTSTCPTGLRWLLLVFLGRDQEHLASWLAINAAVQHFICDLDSKHTLSSFRLISKARLQRLTEVAHICCVLKVLMDLGADTPLAFCSVTNGESVLTACIIRLISAMLCL